MQKDSRLKQSITNICNYIKILFKPYTHDNVSLSGGYLNLPLSILLRFQLNIGLFTIYIRLAAKWL